MAIKNNEEVLILERSIPVLYCTDVLVVGGGSAGATAAISAKRTGAEVTIVERDGSFGGLWTNGLVLRLFGTHAKENGKDKNYFGGIGREIVEELSKINCGAKAFGEDMFEPVPDPEAVVHVLDEMITREGVKVLLRCLAVDVVMEESKILGVVFESKSGKFAILAKIVIDATGDGDVFSLAGAEYKKITTSMGLNFLVGNADRVNAETGDIVTHHWCETPNQSVIWVNTHTKGCDLEDILGLSRIEMEQRTRNWRCVQELKAREGCHSAFLLRTASQLGIRMTRALKGVLSLSYNDAIIQTSFEDTIGISGWANYEKEYKEEKGKWNIPYSILVPEKIEGLLIAGRCVSAEERILNQLRLIPNCMLTGHAAGVAATICVKNNIEPRNVDILELRNALKEQGAIIE